jgi:hypothetical protein
MAMIEFSLGESLTALHEAGFAKNELRTPSFEKVLFGNDAAAATTALLAVEREKAEVLITIISERRRNG